MSFVVFTEGFFNDSFLLVLTLKNLFIMKTASSHVDYVKQLSTLLHAHVVRGKSYKQESSVMLAAQ